MSVFDYKRRQSWPVRVGETVIGGDNPIRIQSMTNTSTMDTDASIAQTVRIALVGGEIVRLTAQGVREATNLANIHSGVRAAGVSVPLVADIHFNPKAAFEAARHVEKVRINPGNFVDPGRTFKHLDYTDEEYAAEIDRIAATFVPLLELCRENGTAIRIGVNHGSLSDRIMSRYGDTPAGMVESAMEFLRIAVANDFRDIVISIKASNTVVMVETVRRLVRAMDGEGMSFPLHLGVTEAGDGDDGRIKSAVGIGALLAHGIGDTIRVSLSEEPECEIPVARALADYITSRAGKGVALSGDYYPGYDPIAPGRRPSQQTAGIGGGATVVALEADKPDEALFCHLDADMPAGDLISSARKAEGKVLLLTTAHPDPVGAIEAAIHALTAAGVANPVAVRLSYDGSLTADDVILRASADFGALLMDGMADGISIQSGLLPAERIAALELDILQAARCRFTKTEFISCPGCGRTLFDLQSTVRAVKAAVSHLKGLKIAVMGCIVNGPGEMADADYGYVGAAAGKVSLYRGKQCLEMNIPAEEALDRLIEILKADGQWHDPE
ncbi:MAG: (E)-4-hydroxy-3-methylbut-2-enyl-diphosphate synthase [Muribaculaceae bacterium]|nr:(E)-4-hydroxy-3-methylbut-2-enyl-diphosphate synthase [Muribaculaceae bacterium]